MTESEYERGTVPERVEWIQETTTGEIPTDPTWEPLSDNIRTHPQWEPDANTQRQDATGEAEAQGFFNGAETHELTFEYDLQRWFVDGSGNTVDPHGDFLRPSSDNALRNTHAYLLRDEYDTGGNDSAGFRTYLVAKGGRPSDSEIPFETEDGSPIMVDPTYQFEKIRRYTIHQPSSDTTIEFSSTSANDTTQDVKIEDEGANTTESNTLTGTSPVTTTATFGDIDAVELSAETEGDITLTDGSGTTLMEIKGQNSYPAGEGDLGVPALGSGSHASSIGADYERFIDDSITLPNLTASDIEIVGGSLEVDTGIDDDAVSGDTARRSIYSTNWTYTFNIPIAGKRVNVDQTINYLTEQTGDITWDADGTQSVVGKRAFIQSPGEHTKEQGEGKIVYDNEFEAETVNINP